MCLTSGLASTGVNGPPASEIARTAEQRESLAKGWLVRMIEAAPLSSAGSIPASWIASEAPALIGEIATALGEPDSNSLTLGAAPGGLGESLKRLQGDSAPEHVAVDLATLHTMLIEEIARLAAPQPCEAFVQALARLAELFGAIQAEFAGTLVATAAAPSPAIGQQPAPRPATEFEDWLQVLIAGQRRYGEGFALALIEIDGVERIRDAYGDDAAERTLKAVTGVVGRQIRASDRTFELPAGELCVLAPHTDAGELITMVERLVELIARSQSEEGPRIAVIAGVVDCPSDGATTDELISSVHEAGYAAKAAGVSAARIQGSVVSLQDP